MHGRSSRGDTGCVFTFKMDGGLSALVYGVIIFSLRIFLSQCVKWGLRMAYPGVDSRSGRRGQNGPLEVFIVMKMTQCKRILNKKIKL